jgi:hypothetical protein
VFRRPATIRSATIVARPSDPVAPKRQSRVADLRSKVGAIEIIGFCWQTFRELCEIASTGREAGRAPRRSAPRPSAGSCVRQSGGARPRMSPCGMARPITPLLQQRRGDGGADLPRRVEERPRRRVFRELDRAEQALAADLAHMGMLVQRGAQLAEQIGAGLPRIGHQPLTVDQRQIGDARRRADGMGGIGPAMADGAVLVGAAFQHRPHLLADDGARQRRIGRGQPLGDGDEVGAHAVMVGAEHGPEPPEAGHHLVGDQQDVVFLQHRLDRRPVARGRRHETARAEHRLADEGGDGLGAFREDQRLQPLGAPGRELFLGHARLGTAEVIGRLGVDHLRQRQVELLVEQLQPRQRAGHQPRAVIAAPARDDLLLLGPAEDVVVVPDQLDVGLVGVRPAEAEIDLRHPRRRPFEDHVRERDRGFGAVADIGVVIGQLARLRGDGVGDLGAAIADIHAIEPGEGVEQAAAVTVLDIDALAAGDHARGRLAARMLGEMGGGVEERLAVPLGELVVGEHVCLLKARAQAQSRQTYLTSVKASRPWRAPSRPSPDCLTPPNGIGAPVTLVRLTATMPNCSARLRR